MKISFKLNKDLEMYEIFPAGADTSDEENSIGTIDFIQETYSRVYNCRYFGNRSDRRHFYKLAEAKAYATTFFATK